MKIYRIALSQLFMNIILLALIILDSGCIAQASPPIQSTRTVLNRFVTRAGSQLMMNGRPFRFAGANMHWLPFDDSTTYTSQVRIMDGLADAQEMRLTVVRSHGLGICTG